MFSHRNEAGTSRRPIYKDLALLQLAALVFATDQFTKFLVREFLALGESFPAEGFFRFTHTFNTGSAFGLFQGQNLPLILVSVIGITILALIYRGQRRPGHLLRLSLALQCGGAAGNLLDRLRLGYVTDFVDVGPWPIFNVADASIVVGLALLAWIIFGSKRDSSPGEGSPGRGETDGIS
jgi:signal peptidase II